MNSVTFFWAFSHVFFIARDPQRIAGSGYEIVSGWNIRPVELNKRSIATLDGSRKNGDYSCKFTTN